MGVQTHPHPHPLSSRMRGPIPPVVLADAGTHLSPRCPRGCVDPSPSCPRGCVDSPPVVLADAWTHPTRCPCGCVDPPLPLPRRACPREDGCGDPSPPVVPADAWTHPHPLSPRMRGPIPTRCPRGCGDPSPSPRGMCGPIPLLADAGTSPRRCPRGCVDPSPSLSSRMRDLSHCPRGRGPIPLVVLADAWTHPPVVPADAWTHPHPCGCVDPSSTSLSPRMQQESSDAFPTRCPRMRGPIPTRADAGICPREDGCGNPSPSPPRQSPRPPYPSSSSFFLAGARRRRRLFG